MFAEELGAPRLQPREVAARPRPAGREARVDKIAPDSDHNRNRGRGLLDRERCGGGVRPEDVRLTVDQVGGEGRETGGLALPIDIPG